MKQFDCSVFKGPISGINSRVFDVRRRLLAGDFFGTSMFDFRLNTFDNYVRGSNANVVLCKRRLVVFVCDPAKGLFYN